MHLALAGNEMSVTGSIQPEPHYTGPDSITANPRAGNIWYVLWRDWTMVAFLHLDGVVT